VFPVAVTESYTACVSSVYFENAEKEAKKKETRLKRRIEDGRTEQRKGRRKEEGEY
jgi:hypothetical protein